MRSVIKHVRCNAVAYVALFVALGGTSYAALKLPANSVGTKQLQRGAVTLPKMAAAARRALHGASGPPGQPGRAFTVSTTLASDQTETGIFGGGEAFGSTSTPMTEQFIPIELRIPLAASIGAPNFVRVPAGTASAPHCPRGGAADRGFFCLYELYNFGGARLTDFLDPLASSDGVGRYGTVLYYTDNTNRRLQIYGTWAVTAP